MIGLFLFLTDLIVDYRKYFTPPESYPSHYRWEQECISHGGQKC